MTRLIAGDCLEVLLDLADKGELFDGAVTDPPYNLTSIAERFGMDDPAPAHVAATGVFARQAAGFMGQKWDTDVAFQAETWRRVLAVLKPGAFLLAFAATRNYHRMATAIEAAGFIVYDMIQWQYGSGFPKNHNIPKAIDKAVGVYGPWQDPWRPISEQAKRWEGHGTALKPAQEPICVAMKPREGTIVQNLFKHGVGVLNIRACRIGTEEELRSGAAKLWSHYREGTGGTFDTVKPGDQDPDGRWPANIIHDGSGEVLARYPAQAGQRGTVRGDEPSMSTQNIFQRYERASSDMRADSGSAARFFYSGKAKASERATRCEICNTRYMGDRAQCCGVELDTHATVKPVDIMRYLLRMVVPQGGKVLDPFAGTGTTGIAAIAEGLDCTMIEIDPLHVGDIQFRIDRVSGYDLPLLGGAR